MSNPNKAAIYLADDRIHNETAVSRSLRTFSQSAPANDHRHSFGELYRVSDEALDSGCSVNMTVEQDSFIVLLPVFGAIDYSDSTGRKNIFAAGQVQILRMKKGSTFTISNPFDQELVNVLELRLKADDSMVFALPWLYTYDVNEALNRLIHITPFPATGILSPFSISIGKFEGRKEAVYKARKNEQGVFVFVLEGAFEIEGRLLHARDGLALWNAVALEMEALSNEAIVLVVGLPLG